MGPCGGPYRDPGSPKLRMVMEYFAFRFGDCSTLHPPRFGESGSLYRVYRCRFIPFPFMKLLGSTFAICFFSETLQKVGSGSCVGDVSPIKPSFTDTSLKFNMEPENDGFQKESPFPGADFQVPGKLEARGVYCISLVSPSISSDFVCRNRLSCPLLEENNLIYIPPKTKKSLQKGPSQKERNLLPIMDILRGFQIGVRELGVASLQTFWILLGSTGLSPVYAL